MGEVVLAITLDEQCQLCLRSNLSGMSPVCTEERHPSPLPKEDGPGASEFTREYDGGTDCQNGQLGLLLSKYPVFR